MQAKERLMAHHEIVRFSDLICSTAILGLGSTWKHLGVQFALDATKRRSIRYLEELMVFAFTTFEG